MTPFGAGAGGYDSLTSLSMDRRTDLRLAERGGWLELLRIPAALFGGIARARGALYDRRILPAYQVDVPVVSVGNLAAGGTGKTPMIGWLIGELERRGLRPGILSRGYGAEAGELNDEGRMLAEAFPAVPHVQNRNRVEGAGELAAHGVDVVLVDDGFQHRRLARDVDLVLVDALRPFGLPKPARGGEPVRAPLPRGLMREPLRALRRASLILVTRSDAVEPAELEALEAQLRRAAPGVGIARAAHEPVDVRPFGGGVPKGLGHLDGLSLDLLSGIGNPGAFEATAKGLGAVIEEHRAFGDHHPFTAADLQGLGQDRPVVTTAKDAARITGLAGVDAPPGLLILDVALNVTTGRAILGALLDTLPESRAARERRSIHEGLHG